MNLKSVMEEEDVTEEEHEKKAYRLSVALSQEDWDGINEYVRRTAQTKASHIKRAVREYLVRGVESGELKNYQVPE